MNCRFCEKELSKVFIDLVSSPAANSFLTAEQLNEAEIVYPLKAFVCDHCFLVQIAEYKKYDCIFNREYVYFSSYSTSWLEHAKSYTQSTISRFGIDHNSHIIEIASNDGYLLQYFKEKDIPVLGIEPTANTAEVAREKGIETIVRFFGTELASELAADGRQADLLIGNNVLAHVPNLMDFVAGLKVILSEKGIITMEFPHLVKLIDNIQFDTIYHEHFSYFSFYTVKKIFESQGLEMFDVEEIPTHGGSLRIYAKHVENSDQPISQNVRKLLEIEISRGINTMDYYAGFQLKVQQLKLLFSNFLIQQKLRGKKVVAYGAAAKGNTLINYCGIKSDQIEYVVDANPNKQNKWLPESHIPVVSEEMLVQEKPDYILILPWNLKDEIARKLSYSRAWGCKFVVAVPMLEILETFSAFKI